MPPYSDVESKTMPNELIDIIFDIVFDITAGNSIVFSVKFIQNDLEGSAREGEFELCFRVRTISGKLMEELDNFHRLARILVQSTLEKTDMQMNWGLFANDSESNM